MTPLCQAPQLSRSSLAVSQCEGWNRAVIKYILKSENMVNADVWMKPFQTKCQNTTSFLLLFESHGNLAASYSDFPSGACLPNAFPLMAYFRNLISLSASGRRSWGNLTILDCLDAVFITLLTWSLRVTRGSYLPSLGASYFIKDCSPLTFREDVASQSSLFMRSCFLL